MLNTATLPTSLRWWSLNHLQISKNEYCNVLWVYCQSLVQLVLINTVSPIMLIELATAYYM